ncbi:hypothetical protein G2W53_027519 [Senna tora]|uniref:Retrotransposon gag domain-containing protein n=1 Tax=Senna tora TaxID=362788 RepID=A0A834WMA8_9FABA|nr:hypothetical protein G2W53_027519 [Senna tora]
MMKQFLNKYFPASRVIAIWRDICGIKQKPTETLHDYWERFKRLCASCPQHGVSEQGLIHYFYQGLHPTERGILDATSGGSIVEKTPTEGREIISTMAATSQDFGDSQDMPRIVNEASISYIESKLNQLTNMSRHTTPRQYMPAPAPKPNSSLEDVVKSLASSMQNLEQQMSQLATSVSKLESQGKLPSQTETNPKHDASAITLRSGKELENVPAKLRRGHALDKDAGTEPKAELQVEKQPERNQKEEKQSPSAELIAQLPFHERNNLCKLKQEFDVDIELEEFIQEIETLASKPVEITSIDIGNFFKVNGHRLKSFYEGFQNITVEEIKLVESHLELGSSQSPA